MLCGTVGEGGRPIDLDNVCSPLLRTGLSQGEHSFDAVLQNLDAPSHNVTPEKIYEQRWAVTLLERALARLKCEAGSSPPFDTLRVFLTGNSPGNLLQGTRRQVGDDRGGAQGSSAPSAPAIWSNRNCTM
jgi:hypothetical protein